MLETVPPFIQHKESPCVVYKYTQPIGPQIFNFSQASKSDIFRKPEPCECHQSHFIYKPLGHVVTSDLRIVSNPKLRKLLKKGTKFREPNNFNWVTALKMCKEGLRKYKITYLLLYLVSGKMLYLRKLLIGSLSCLNRIPNPQ